MIELNWPTDESIWVFNDDPASILKVGDVVFHGLSEIKVMGFSAPCGRSLDELMVHIGYKNHEGNFPETYSTTIDNGEFLSTFVIPYWIDQRIIFRFKMHINCQCGTQYTFAGSVHGQYTCPNCGDKNTPAMKA